MKYEMKVMNRTCPTCNANNYEEVHSQKNNYIIGFDTVNYENFFVVCKQCGLVYSNPVPIESELLKYYSKFCNYTNSQYFGKSPQEADNKFNRIFNLIKNEFKPNFKGKVIEIGCGTGAGLKIFKDNGWDVLGIEPSEIAAKIAKKIYNIDIINTFFDISTVKSIDKAEVVILSHVLEHLISPDEILSLIKSVMTTSGILYIEVPNLLKPFKSNGYFTFEHLNYFTPNTLRKLLQRHGLTSTITTFDNGGNIEPFYPVIASISKINEEYENDIINDYEISKKTVNHYLEIVDTLNFKLKYKLFQIFELFKGKKISIWGAGLHTTFILNLLENKADDIFCFFDNDPQKNEMILNNKTIFYCENIEDIIDKVDCIIISSVMYEKEIYEQLKVLLLNGVSIYKLYDNEEIK